MKEPGSAMVVPPGSLQHLIPPARYPTILLRIYTQAQHLELDFYNQFFAPGAYLQTHAEHMQRWHSSQM